MRTRTLVERLALAGLAVLAGLAWRTPMGAPFRLLVVLFHELGHAGAALLTGGEVLGIAVRLDESGHAVTRGGWETLVLNAGYLGAQGIGIVLVALGRSFPRFAGGVLATLFAAGAWWAGVSLAGGACVVVAGLTLAVIVCASRPSHAAAGAWMLRWGVQGIGVLAIVHAVLDAASDFGVGDAALLAGRTLVPAVAWSALWVMTGTASTVVWAHLEARGALRSS